MFPRSIELEGEHGLRLHATEWRAHGAVALLIHGFGQHGRVWDDVAGALDARVRPIALDLRGHGDSAAPDDGDYRVTTLTRDVAHAIEQLGATRAVLVGHSLGGRVALEVAATHPERVRALVLVDVGDGKATGAAERVRRDVGRSPRTVASPEAYAAALLPSYPLADPEAVRRFARHALRRRDDGLYEEKFDARFKRAPAAVERGAHEVEPVDGLAALLARVEAPTLVARAIGSAVLARPAARHMAEVALRRGTLVEIPRSGHSVTLDNPAGLAKEIDHFLDIVTRAGA